MSHMHKSKTQYASLFLFYIFYSSHDIFFNSIIYNMGDHNGGPGSPKTNLVFKNHVYGWKLHPFVGNLSSFDTEIAYHQISCRITISLSRVSAVRVTNLTFLYLSLTFPT